MLGLQAVLLISMALGHPLPVSGSAVATFVAHLVSYADPIRWGATIALVGSGPLAALGSRL